jgi:hypothetical protein
MAMARDASTRSGSQAARAARYLGAAFVIATGAVHLQQYFGVYYRVIPTIGPLFLANFVLAGLLGLSLLAPIERINRRLPALLAIGGILCAAGTIIGLAISESGTLFGFHEHGYRLAVVLSIVFEAAAIISLTSYLLVATRIDRRQPVAGDRQR